MATPINKLLKMLKISDEDEEEISDDDVCTDDEESSFASRRSEESSSAGLSSSGRGRSSETSVRTRTPRNERTPQKNIVPYNRSSKTKGSLEVCIHKPEQFNDAAEICNLLIEGRPVIVNLEGFDSYEAQRIMDFICGCIHALDGSLRQISKYIFIFSPYGVEITGDITFDVNGVPIFKKNY